MFIPLTIHHLNDLLRDLPAFTEEEIAVMASEATRSFSPAQAATLRRIWDIEFKIIRCWGEYEKTSSTIRLTAIFLSVHEGLIAETDVKINKMLVANDWRQDKELLALQTDLTRMETENAGIRAVNDAATSKLSMLDADITDLEVEHAKLMNLLVRFSMRDAAFDTRIRALSKLHNPPREMRPVTTDTAVEEQIARHDKAASNRIKRKIKRWAETQPPEVTEEQRAALATLDARRKQIAADASRFR